MFHTFTPVNFVFDECLIPSPPHRHLWQQRLRKYRHGTRELQDCCASFIHCIDLRSWVLLKKRPSCFLDCAPPRTPNFNVAETVFRAGRSSPRRSRRQPFGPTLKLWVRGYMEINIAFGITIEPYGTAALHDGRFLALVIKNSQTHKLRRDKTFEWPNKSKEDAPTVSVHVVGAAGADMLRIYTLQNQ